MIPYRPYLSDIAEQFDLFIIDLWGVLHDGKAAFRLAIEALAQLRKLHKPVVLLSNSPRRSEHVKQRLEELGISQRLYDHLYTSGEDCYRHLKLRQDPWYAALGESLFHIGQPLDRSLFDALPFQQTANMDAADFIITTGTASWDSPLEEYENILTEACGKHLPMICANPDEIVMFGNLKSFCAGAIASRYKDMGGFVRYHGKPFAPIYTAILNLYPDVKRQRILAIGDSLATDILGAKSANISALMIMNGIHRQQFETSQKPLDTLNQLLQLHPFVPDYLAPELAW